MTFKSNVLRNLFYSSSVKRAGINSVLKSIGYLASLFMVFILLNIPLYAQDWRWPEKPENLQVLGEEYTGRRLGGMMRQFIIGLGVRCEHCHVGKAGQPLSSFDFPSDANPNKNRARKMLKMTNNINEELRKIDSSGTNRIEASCITCHHGLPRPIPLHEKLDATLRAKGLEATLAQYLELREEYYGEGSYQFRERVLNDLGYEVLGDNPEGAIKAFKLNTKMFPESFIVWDSLAEGYMVAGDNKKAIKYFKKSLKMNPDNHNAEVMLERIKKGK